MNTVQSFVSTSAQIFTSGLDLAPLICVFGEKLMFCVEAIELKSVHYLVEPYILQLG